MSIWIYGFLAYWVVGYLTALAVAWLSGEDETAGMWFSVAAFWPLMWLIGVIVLAIWLFEIPTAWLAGKRRERWRS